MVVVVERVVLAPHVHSQNLAAARHEWQEVVVRHPVEQRVVALHDLETNSECSNLFVGMASEAEARGDADELDVGGPERLDDADHRAAREDAVLGENDRTLMSDARGDPADLVLERRMSRPGAESERLAVHVHEAVDLDGDALGRIRNLRTGADDDDGVAAPCTVDQRDDLIGQVAHLDALHRCLGPQCFLCRSCDFSLDVAEEAAAGVGGRETRMAEGLYLLTEILGDDVDALPGVCLVGGMVNGQCSSLLLVD